jgi:hypothetical protein
MTIDQAILSQERAEPFKKDVEFGDFGFSFQINLGNIALGDLEKPVIQSRS